MKPNIRTGLRARGMMVGEAAEAAGVGVQTLHFYEQQGLIPPSPRTDSGYRLYAPETVERVRFIRKAQALGFSLDEVKEIFGLVRQGSSPCGRVQTKLAEKLNEVDRRLEELRGFRAELASLVAQAAELSMHEAEAGVCSIVEEAKPLSVSPLIKPPLTRKKRVSARPRESAQKK